MPTNYSDGGLVRGSKTVSISNVNYLFKSLKFDNPVRSAYEYDGSGLPKASSHVNDFSKFSGEVMVYTNVNVPPTLTLFNADLGYGATNYALLDLTFNYSTEGLQSYSTTGVKLYN